jgi:hypothetical protein
MTLVGIVYFNIELERSNSHYKCYDQWFDHEKLRLAHPTKKKKVVMTIKTRKHSPMSKSINSEESMPLRKREQRKPQRYKI